MLFYVRHRADGRKKHQFDLHDDLLFIPLATSFVLALTLDWTTAVDGSRGVIRGVSNTAQPNTLERLEISIS
jgi:hypothetical protein